MGGGPWRHTSVLPTVWEYATAAATVEPIPKSKPDRKKIRRRQLPLLLLDMFAGKRRRAGEGE